MVCPGFVSAFCYSLICNYIIRDHAALTAVDHKGCNTEQYSKWLRVNLHHKSCDAKDILPVTYLISVK